MITAMVEKCVSVALGGFERRFWRTQCRLRDSPQRKPGATRRAVAVGLDTDLHNPNAGYGNAKYPNAEYSADADPLR